MTEHPQPILRATHHRSHPLAVDLHLLDVVKSGESEAGSLSSRLSLDCLVSGCANIAVRDGKAGFRKNTGLGFLRFVEEFRPFRLLLSWMRAQLPTAQQVLSCAGQTSPF